MLRQMGRLLGITGEVIGKDESKCCDRLGRLLGITGVVIGKNVRECCDIWEGCME